MLITGVCCWRVLISDYKEKLSYSCGEVLTDPECTYGVAESKRGELAGMRATAKSSSRNMSGRHNWKVVSRSGVWVRSLDFVSPRWRVGSLHNFCLAIIEYTETKSEQNIILIRSLHLLYKEQVERSWNNNDKLLTTIFGDTVTLSTMRGTFNYNKITLHTRITNPIFNTVLRSNTYLIFMRIISY
jgi:hypothetical protein